MKKQNYSHQFTDFRQVLATHLDRLGKTISVVQNWKEPPIGLVITYINQLQHLEGLLTTDLDEDYYQSKKRLGSFTEKEFLTMAYNKDQFPAVIAQVNKWFQILMLCAVKNNRLGLDRIESDTEEEEEEEQ